MPLGMQRGIGRKPLAKIGIVQKTPRPIGRRRVFLVYVQKPPRLEADNAFFYVSSLTLC